MVVLFSKWPLQLETYFPFLNVSAIIDHVCPYIIVEKAIESEFSLTLGRLYMFCVHIMSCVLNVVNFHLAAKHFKQQLRLSDIIKHYGSVANNLSGLNAYLLVACTLIMTLKDVQYIAYSYQIWGEQMQCGYTQAYRQTYRQTLRLRTIPYTIALYQFKHLFQSSRQAAGNTSQTTPV